MPEKESKHWPAEPGAYCYIWARKGSAIKQQLIAYLRLAFNHLKALRADRHPYRLHYGEHELSFDDTPTFQFKKHRRPFFPCIEPPLVSFDDDDDDIDNESFFVETKEECHVMDGDGEGGDAKELEGEAKGSESIDLKAEFFISRFYEEMKLQRQVSYLQYNEMLYRGIS